MQSILQEVSAKQTQIFTGFEGADGALRDAPGTNSEGANGDDAIYHDNNAHNNQAPDHHDDGREYLRNHYQAHHPVVLVPGTITTGLELWQGAPCASGKVASRNQRVVRLCVTHPKRSVFQRTYVG